jgi:hypothetical protein
MMLLPEAVDSNGNGRDGVKPHDVNNGEGGQRRAWYYHFIENLYRMRMVIPGNLGRV